MTRFLLVCLGGAVGTGARCLLSGWVADAAGHAFPWGTLAVNVLGSFLLGAILFAFPAPEGLSVTRRDALTTGVMGGFTTCSTFNHEATRSLREGAFGTAGLYVAVTLVACLVPGLAGIALGRGLASR